MNGQHFDLKELGWNEFFTSAFDTLGDRDLVPARVCIQHNYLYHVWASQGELLSESSGKLRREASGPEELPAVERQPFEQSYRDGATSRVRRPGIQQSNRWSRPISMSFF